MYLIRRKSDGKFYFNYGPSYLAEIGKFWVKDLYQAKLYNTTAACKNAMRTFQHEGKSCLYIRGDWGPHTKLVQFDKMYEIVEVEVTLKIKK